MGYLFFFVIVYIYMTIYYLIDFIVLVIFIRRLYYGISTSTSVYGSPYV